MGRTASGPSWVRGVARIVEGEITLDETTIETYRPQAGAGLLAAFLAIEDEVDVAHFASRHGLLRCRGGILREPLGEWWLERDVLRGALALAHDLESVDPVASVEAAWRATALAPAAHDRAADAVVHAIRRGLGDAAVFFGPRGAAGPVELLGDRAHRTFGLGGTAGTLLGLAYLEAARLLTGEEPMRRCPECGLVFVARHRRQAYCSPQHASRARFRRYRRRQQATIP